MKKMLPFILFTFSVTACNDSSYKSASTQDLTLQEVPFPKIPDTKEQYKTKKGIPADTSFTGQASQNNVSNQDWDKRIIKTGHLKVEVENFRKYAGIVHIKAKEYGGYVANEEQNQSEEKIEATISIRVPVDQFESFINDLPSGALKIIEKKITAEDVSGEVIDTKSRLETKKQIRLKYLDFLKQSKNMTEVLQVQAEINELQEEIESASGRISYLLRQAAYSTINLTFYQPFAGYNPTNNPAFSFRITEAFRSGLHFIAELCIAIISVWPLFLILLSLWIVWKKRIIMVTAAKQKS